VPGTWQPSTDRRAAARLRAVLDGVGYSEQTVEGVLGDGAYDAGREDLPVLERRLTPTPLAAVVRACFLGLPTPRADAPPGFADAVVATGLGRADGNAVVPLGRIAPVEGVLLASDAYSRGEDDAAYVATYTPTARTCALLTPRPRVGRALDVGTGSGIHALLAAAHSDHVVATDVNERAVAFAAFNAALNGFDHVEVRRGSLFEPVEGELFDLIVCNAPFVVSPESRFVFRDGLLPADELSERVVAGSVSHLAEGGFATLLVSWVAADPDRPDERPFSWLDGTGCDAWVLGYAGSEPLDHAAGWNDYLQSDPERYAAAVDDWTAYLARLGIRWITEGAVLLHRRAGDGYLVRFDPLDDERLEDAGDQIERVFASRAQVAKNGLPATPLRLAPGVRIVREYDGSELVETRLRQLDGMCLEREISTREAEALAALDGGARLTGDALLALADELVELGFLEAAPSATAS
jgi:methylase of polypeptide subunit release factors